MTVDLQTSQVICVVPFYCVQSVFLCFSVFLCKTDCKSITFLWSRTIWEIQTMYWRSLYLSAKKKVGQGWTFHSHQLSSVYCILLLLWFPLDVWFNLLNNCSVWQPQNELQTDYSHSKKLLNKTFQKQCSEQLFSLLKVDSRPWGHLIFFFCVF